jgi:hypothetical protein
MKTTHALEKETPKKQDGNFEQSGQRKGMIPSN